MSHRVHPKIFRIRQTEEWESRGFYEKDFASYLEEDFKIRKFLEEKIGKFGVAKIGIERSPSRINIIVSTSRPGLIIGRRGEGIERLKQELISKVLQEKYFIKSKKEKGKARLELRLEIREIKNPWVHASLVAQLMAAQIEKRMPYRRVLKQTLSRIMSQKGIKGARVELAGRLNGVSIARKEWLGQGLLPRQTIRADIDYSHKIAKCSYGVIGVKVWIYKGEKFEK
ncbi:MAG: 30S ribosomal protein S3 [Patescibacteria group bacterium]|nr:30S ribosomal protein S3 [Patescibacteria group bacterium]